MTSAEASEAMLEVARDVFRREAAAPANLVEKLDDTMVQVAHLMLSGAGKVVDVTGTGTSGIVRERLAHLLAVTGTPAFYLPCLSAVHSGMDAVSAADHVSAFSNRGKSVEWTQLVTRLAHRGVTAIAVAESPSSDFAWSARHAVLITTQPGDADLGSLISTASTLVAGACADALAAVPMQARKYRWGALTDTHPAGVGQHLELPEPGSWDSPHPIISRTERQ